MSVKNEADVSAANQGQGHQLRYQPDSSQKIDNIQRTLFELMVIGAFYICAI